MADKKKMSVAEILAAARKSDSKGGAAAPVSKVDEEPEAAARPPAAESAEATAESAAATEEAPAPKAASKPITSGERPSVKDILAMARGGGKGSVPAVKPAAAKAPAAASATAPKAATIKPQPAKTATVTAKAPAAAKPVAKDTASILAAARAGAKPGPITKAQAAAMPTATATLAPKAKVAPKEKPTVPPMPAKPAYAKPTPAKVAETDLSRRGFFGMIFGSSLALGMTAMAVTGGLWSLAFARFMFPNVLTEPPSRFKVGFKDSFAPGQVETKFVSLYGVWIVNWEYNGKQEIYALKTVCTHLGCTPNWLEAEQKFKCPCHGSGFYKDGINFEGPAPRPLERYAIRVAEDGQLEVDKGRTFQEEMGQWTDPDCFVVV
jgi:cytochrome b6-f complex iron-sulfur subunit